MMQTRRAERLGRSHHSCPMKSFNTVTKTFFLVCFVFVFHHCFFFSRVSIRKMSENRCESIWRTSVHRWFQNNSVKKSRTSGGGGGEDVSDTLLSPPSEASGQQGRSQTSNAAAATLSHFYILLFLMFLFFACRETKNNHS